LFRSSAARKFGVRVVTRADHDEVNVRVVEHFVRTRNRIRKSKSLADVMRRDPDAVAIERNSTPSLLKCGNNIAGTYPPAPITPNTIDFSAFAPEPPPKRNLRATRCSGS
jgi:hypothetical protein